MTVSVRRSPGLPRVPALLVLVVAQLVLLFAAIHFTPAPRIETTFGGATIDIKSDRSWTILPGQCAAVSWKLEGIQSVYINGEGNVGHGKMAFCPTTSATSLSFRITAGNGDARTFVLNVQDLASSTLIWLTTLMLLVPFLVAGWYLVTKRLTQPVTFDLSLLLALVALLLFGLLIQTARPATVASVLDSLGAVFRSPSWHILGSVLAGLIYVPLTIQIMRRGVKTSIRADLVAIGAFVVIVVLMYLIAGFDSIGQWESWPIQAYFEGRPANLARELISRFWLLVPHALAFAISPNSFAGYHLVNLLMFCGMLVLFYAILRQLRVPPWLAFLAAILFLVYPVNSSLMSLRSIVMTLSKLSLLAAIYIILDCRENFSRWGLLGIWLALLLNLGTYEIAFVIILIVPLLWWRREPTQMWRNINLTLIWFLVPTVKAAHILLLIVSKSNFYGSWLLGGTASGQITLDSVAYHLSIVTTAYRRTFVDGWQEAINAISQNSWLIPTAATLALIGIVSVYLAREAKPGETSPHPRRSPLQF